MDSSSSREPGQSQNSPPSLNHGSTRPEYNKSGLAALVLEALPHPAMLIRPDRTIVFVNRAAFEVGARVGEPCWRSFGQSEFIPEEDKRYINEHAGSLPPGGTKCSFCCCDEAMEDMTPRKVPAVEAFGKLWDTFWVPLTPELFLHYVVDVTAPERLRREAEQLKQKLERILQAAPMGIGMLRSRIMEWVSRPFAHMLGYTPQELEGKNVRMLYEDEAEYLRVPKVKYPQIEKAGVGEVETRLCRKDGSRVDILVRSAAFDPSDLSKGMIFTTLDISERKQAARRLKEKEHYYRSLINSLQEDIIVIDRDLRISDLNNGILKTSGYRRDEIIGKPCYTVLHGANRPCKDRGQPCGHEIALKNGQVVRQQHRHIHRDGSELWADVLSSPIRNDKGHVTHVVESVRDITAFVEQKSKLEYQNTLLEALFETVLGIVKHQDLSSLLEAIVVQAASLAGVPNAFLHLYDHGRKVLETRAGCGVYHDMVGYKIKPGEGLSGIVFERATTMYVEDYQSWPRHLPDDRFRSISAIAAVPLKLENEVLGVLGLSHNETGRKISEITVLPVLERFAGLAVVAISNARLTHRLQDELRRRKQLEKERRQMESWLRQAQKMEAIGTLAGGIAHDFNNILSAVIGFSEISTDDARPGTRLRTNLEEILQAGLRAKDLVQQILTFSRQSETEKVPLQVNLVVKEALKLLRASLPAYVEIREELACDAMVMADATSIHQVVMNLFTNAFHALGDDNGVLEVSLGTVDIDADTATRLSLPSVGNYLQLRISDTGCGMTPELQQKIFDPYFTTKEKELGTGLGLAIVQGIVADCEGAITVESQPGKGSTFTVYLPLIKRHKISSRPAAHDLPVGSGHILFVDDEPAMGVICQQMLEKLGYSVTTRTSSLEALELLRAQPLRFDLVITDQTMPHLTGDALAKEIASICPNMPVILCTGFSEKISEKSAQQLGVCDVLMKPLLRSELADACARALKSKKLS